MNCSEAGCRHEATRRGLCQTCYTRRCRIGEALPPLAIDALPTAPPPPGDWFDLAACKGTDVHAWFPARGQSLKALRAVCETCPVREDCGTYALDHGIKHGVWGGLSERERRLIRRDRRLENA